MLRMPWQHITFLDQQITTLNTEIAARLENFDDSRESLRDVDPQGQQVLREALVESGHAAAKTSTYFDAVYHRLAGRRGKKRAAVATGRHILTSAYAILKTPDRVYQDPGANYFVQRD